MDKEQVLNEIESLRDYVNSGGHGHLDSLKQMIHQLYESFNKVPETAPPVVEPDVSVPEPVVTQKPIEDAPLPKTFSVLNKLKKKPSRKKGSK